jgi:hypothetical protein
MLGQPTSINGLHTMALSPSQEASASLPSRTLARVRINGLQRDTGDCAHQSGFPHYACVAWVNEVGVIRGENF